MISLFSKAETALSPSLACQSFVTTEIQLAQVFLEVPSNDLLPPEDDEGLGNLRGRRVLCGAVG